MKQIHASREETAQKIIDRCGVDTIRHDWAPTQWAYEGKVIKRPEVNRWEDVMKEEFEIEIIYDD